MAPLVEASIVRGGMVKLIVVSVVAPIVLGACADKSKMSDKFEAPTAHASSHELVPLSELARRAEATKFAANSDIERESANPETSGSVPAAPDAAALPEPVAIATPATINMLSMTDNGTYLSPLTANTVPPLELGLAAGDEDPEEAGETANEDEEDWLTRGEKTLVLNVGAATALTLWGIYKWDYFQTEPNASSEGWFAQDTPDGGADKLGHFWSSHAMVALFGAIYDSWGYTPEEATRYGTMSSLGFNTLMELGDSFSEFGFSYEDMIMNIAGAGAGYLLRTYPDANDLIDLRLEYAPNLSDDFRTDVFTDYEHHKYLLALKGEGIDAVKGSAFEYLELQAGYYARGYNDYVEGGPETRSRTFYLGVGVNVGRLIRSVWDTALFDYFQVPGTYIPYEFKLDE
jgi:uncharacterized protein YfiM (DUF2279 family)